jgi:type IV fimbrial biogenesis protein FimT
MQVFSRQRSVLLAPMSDVRPPEDQLSRIGAARRRHVGFTILELMVSLAVAGVLLVIAIPSFRQLIISNKLTTAANDMVAAINVARMEAVKRNASSQFCSDLAANNLTDTLGTQCGTQVGGVAVLNAAGAAVQVLGGVTSIVTPVQLRGNVTALRFTSQGVGQQAGATAPFGDNVAVICTSALSTNNVRTISMVGGTILQVVPSTGACG